MKELTIELNRGYTEKSIKSLIKLFEHLEDTEVMSNFPEVSFICLTTNDNIAELIQNLQSDMFKVTEILKVE